MNLLFAVILGAACIFSFAPFYIYPISVLSLAGLFYLLKRASTVKEATQLGYAYGLGFFSTGVSWVYVSLHDFGGMPFWMAGLFTLAFCAFLALFHATFAYFAKKSQHIYIAMPLFWVLGEWIRSWICTGFPWLNVGNSQIPNSPLAGYAPIFGIYGISLIVAALSSLLAYWFLNRKQNQNLTKKLWFILAIAWISGSALKHIVWSHADGKPFTVALLQGNIPQLQKWQPESAKNIMQQYLSMVKNSAAKLIVLPESAMPVVMEDVPESYIKSLKSEALAHQGDILLGAIEAKKDNYFNSMLSIGSAPTQNYRKSHLVPFGEFIPFKFLIGFIYRDWLNMPLSDIARGSTLQQPMHVAGTLVAVNICYEDAFGEEIIRQLPQAKILVNASNMAWFGNSWAADQHLQMSQARALETGRMMLRATNTGATAVINRDGEIISKLPYFTAATLKSTAQAYTGTTPYVRWGNWPVLLVFLSYFFFYRPKSLRLGWPSGRLP